LKITAKWFALLSLAVLLAGIALAQSSAPPAKPAIATQVSAQQAAAPQLLKVTEYTLPPAKMARAQALYKIRVILYLFGTAFGIVVLWVLVEMKAGAWFRTLAERAGGNSWVQTLVFVPLLMLTLAVISLPIEIYQQHVSRAYGLSVQGWSSWAADWGKGEMLSLVISVPIVWVLFRRIRKSPRYWWIQLWLLSIPFVVFMTFIAPVIIDPMFNKFEPLEKTRPQLVREIEKVNHRGGLNIPRDKMFEMKASEKVTTYNAYVTGIGASKRVVVWDNTSRELTTEETLFIFGHEQGHYVLNHIPKGLAFAIAMMLVGFWVGKAMLLGALGRWGEGWGIRGINDLAMLPVLMLVLSLLTLIGEPIGNAFSRHVEHQADIYGLEVTHGMFANNGAVGASAFQKLGEKAYSYPKPHPFLIFWSYTHPPVTDRIKFSLGYDPWDTAEGPEFVK
jgi:STE24 endopeptidase